jgi:hypothetical protein
MEETTQQISQKQSLPIKTKIAAWWLMIIGGIASIVCLVFVMKTLEGTCWSLLPFLMVLFLPSFLTFLFGFFIVIARKKWAWWLGITILFIEVLISGILISEVVKVNIINGFPVDFKSVIFAISPFLFLTPFILLLLDRKNFFKIAS